MIREVLAIEVLIVSWCLIHASEPRPAIEGRPRYAFLKNAPVETQIAFKKLDENRELPRKEIEKQKDALIATQTPEIQELYNERKMFDAERDKEMNKQIIAVNSEINDSKLQETSQKILAITNDMNLSRDEVCQKLVLLRLRVGDTDVARPLWAYGCVKND
ncbi:hypothetical protein M3Y94_00247400 [Aphelenchoides besseyi]|nr:hypothetical protein M3Y94_00247400 [Aphelenchoides besseyi]KAI6236290.1 hypothetical protein M3Y95_00141800 [Aphelenchoides besseyi]